MYSKPFPTLIPTHLVPSHCLYPFGGDNSVLPDSIDPLDSTRLPRLHRWIPSSPCTTQRRRVRRVLHNFVEFTLLYTTTKREVSSKGNGRRPGEGRRSDWREEHNRVTKRPWQEEGDLFGDLLVHLTRGEAHHREARHRAARLEAHHRAARLDGVHKVVQDKGQQDRQIL